jgi:predicted RNA binding protein YcfA (HicA-like mRNA interferase family)
VSPTPVITARELMSVLTRLGFVQIRSHGSHRRFAHQDGRKTVVPVHAGRDIPKGLLRKIVTMDMEMTMEEFISKL